MPLSMTLSRSNNTPLVTPCFDGEDLHVDSELVSSGLSAISVKGYDAGDPKEEIGIRHRNSFWSVHRPELSKLNWATDHTPQDIENYLKIQAGNQHCHTEFEKFDVPPADFNKLTVIHANSEHQHAKMDEDLLVSKPQTTQLSDEDLASHTTLHKSRAEFCVTIGHLGERSIFGRNDIKEFIDDTSEPSSSKTVRDNSEGNRLSQEPEENNAISELRDKPLENLENKQTDKQLPGTLQEIVIASMDDTVKYQQSHESYILSLNQP